MKDTDVHITETEDNHSKSELNHIKVGCSDIQPKLHSKGK